MQEVYGSAHNLAPTSKKKKRQKPKESLPIRTDPPAMAVFFVPIIGFNHVFLTICSHKQEVKQKARSICHPVYEKAKRNVALIVSALVGTGRNLYKCYDVGNMFAVWTGMLPKPGAGSQPPARS